MSWLLTPGSYHAYSFSYYAQSSLCYPFSLLLSSPILYPGLIVWSLNAYSLLELVWSCLECYHCVLPIFSLTLLHALFLLSAILCYLEHAYSFSYYGQSSLCYPFSLLLSSLLLAFLSAMENPFVWSDLHFAILCLFLVLSIPIGYV